MRDSTRGRGKKSADRRASAGERGRLDEKKKNCGEVEDCHSSNIRLLKDLVVEQPSDREDHRRYAQEGEEEKEGRGRKLQEADERNDGEVHEAPSEEEEEDDDDDDDDLGGAEEDKEIEVLLASR